MLDRNEILLLSDQMLSNLKARLSKVRSGKQYADETRSSLPSTTDLEGFSNEAKLHAGYHHNSHTSPRSTRRCNHEAKYPSLKTVNSTTAAPPVVKGLQGEADFVNTEPSKLPAQIGSSIYEDLEPYIYEPLPTPRHIRVLVKLMSNQDPVFGMRTISVDDKIAYDTVSYVWSSSNRVCRLVLADGRYIPITRSLSHAIGGVFAHSKVRVIWVDQLCINQENLLERNHQVNFMGDIYRNCNQVLIWIKEHGTCQRWHRLLDHVQPLVHDKWPTNLHLQLNGVIDCLGGGWHSDPKIPRERKELHATWLSLVNMMKNEWFMRAWTFQEAVLPPTATFVFGDKAMEFNEFFQMIAAVQFFENERLENADVLRGVRRSIGMERLHAIARLRTVDARKLNDCAFWTLLSEVGASSRCSVRIDMIYAYLGLRADDGAQIIVDYSQSIGHILNAATRSIISSRRSLDILGLAGERYGEGIGLATWACDWTTREVVRPLWSIGHPDYFSAYGGKPMHYMLDDNNNSSELCLKGHQLDVVQLRLATSRNDAIGLWSQRDPFEYLNFQQIAERLLQTTHRQADSKIMQHRLLRVFTADGVLERQDGNNTIHISEDWLSKLLSLHATRVYSNKAQVNEPDLVRYRSLTQIARNRVLCVTKDGRLSLGPWTAEIGDIIVAVAGSAVPLILRRNNPESRDVMRTTYKYVGQAYVEGVMFRESILDWQRCPSNFILV